MMPAWRGSLVLLVLWPGLARAQDHCFPGSDSHEAQVFGILSTPLAFTASGAATMRSAIGVEMTSIPKVPEELATPTTCRPGKGPENTNPLPGFARLRLELALGVWRIDAGWIPPVRVRGVRSNLLGFGVSRTMRLGTWLLTPRAHAVVGRVRGPFTCNAEALRDDSSECFEGTLSNDRWDPNIAGIEATLSRSSGGLVPHAGIGWSALRPRFQVDFTNAQGDVDRRKVEVDLQRLALFAGLSARVARVHLSGEGYFTVGDRVAARMMMRLPLQGDRDDALP
jgi:hypothetical protein